MEHLQELFGQSSLPEQSCSFAETSNSSIALHAGLGTNKPWVIDSGASDHMLGNSSVFISYSPCYGNLRVKTVDGSIASVVGKGIVKLSRNLALDFVLHVPSLTCNLLSISKLTKDLRYPLF